MKVPNDPRLYVHQLGVLMTEPRVRFTVSDEQNMTSVGFETEARDAVVKFVAVLEDYFRWTAALRQALTAGQPAPAVPESIVNLFATKEPKRVGKADKASS